MGMQVLVSCQHPSQRFYFLGKISSFIRVGKSGQNEILSRPRSTNRVQYQRIQNAAIWYPVGYCSDWTLTQGLGFFFYPGCGSRNFLNKECCALNSNYKSFGFFFFLCLMSHYSDFFLGNTNTFCTFLFFLFPVFFPFSPIASWSAWNDKNRIGARFLT